MKSLFLRPMPMPEHGALDHWQVPAKLAMHFCTGNSQLQSSRSFPRGNGKRSFPPMPPPLLLSSGRVLHERLACWMWGLAPIPALLGAQLVRLAVFVGRRSPLLQVPMMHALTSFQSSLAIASWYRQPRHSLDEGFKLVISCTAVHCQGDRGSKWITLLFRTSSPA